MSVRLRGTSLTHLVTLVKGRASVIGAGDFPVGIAAVAGLATLFVTKSVQSAAQTGTLPADLHIFWLAGRAYLHGHSPYPPVSSVGTQGDLFVYPAPMAALFGLLGWMPLWGAALVWTPIGVAAIFAALRLLGVRDVRCVVLALLTFPVASGIMVGTLSPLLVLAVAALWAWRDNERRAALAATFLLISKLFLWPLLVWLVVTRRYRAAAYAILMSAGLTLAAWAPIGFRGLGSYPVLLRRLAALEGADSYQPVWLLPGSSDLRLSVLALLGFVGVGVLAVLGRRQPGVVSFRAAIVLSLALSPIVWAHYFVLLLPLLGPSLSLAWLPPLALWALSPDQLSHGRPWRVALAVGVVGGVAVLARHAGDLRLPKNRLLSSAGPAPVLQALTRSQRRLH